MTGSVGKVYRCRPKRLSQPGWLAQIYLQHAYVPTYQCTYACVAMFNVQSRCVLRLNPQTP